MTFMEKATILAQCLAPGAQDGAMAQQCFFVFSQAASVVDFITSFAVQALIHDTKLRESPDTFSHQFHHLRLFNSKFCCLFY